MLKRVTARDREIAVIEALRKHGALEKGELDTHVSTILKTTPTEISKSLYRDLKRLVREGQIQEQFFTMGDEPIPKDHPLPKAYKTLWSTEKKNQNIEGDGILSNIGARILSSEGLESDILVQVFSSITIQPERQYILLHIGTSRIVISLPLIELPVTLVLHRINREQNAEDIVQKIKTNTTYRRIISIEIDSPLISSLNTTLTGHLSIQLKENEFISFVPKETKNDVTFSEFDTQQIGITTFLSSSNISQTKTSNQLKQSEEVNCPEF